MLSLTSHFSPHIKSWSNSPRNTHGNEILHCQGQTTSFRLSGYERGHKFNDGIVEWEPIQTHILAVWLTHNHRRQNWSRNWYSLRRLSFSHFTDFFNTCFTYPRRSLYKKICLEWSVSCQKCSRKNRILIHAINHDARKETWWYVTCVSCTPYSTPSTYQIHIWELSRIFQGFQSAPNHFHKLRNITLQVHSDSHINQYKDGKLDVHWSEVHKKIMLALHRNCCEATKPRPSSRIEREPVIKPYKYLVRLP